MINDEDEDEVLIPDKNSYLEERYIYNDSFLESQNYNSNYKNKNNSINQNIIDNNNSLLFSDNSKSFQINSVSAEPVGGVFKKNIESTFFKFMN